MPKMIFTQQKKAGTSREACLKYWEGEQHTTIVRTIPGLAKCVQNHVISACDGVGEMWFESDEAMQSALTSPAMAAAVEDAKNFLIWRRPVSSSSKRRPSWGSQDGTMRIAGRAG
jgi:uncharacterized protein (TIGR02118 family)